MKPTEVMKERKSKLWSEIKGKTILTKQIRKVGYLFHSSKIVLSSFHTNVTGHLTVKCWGRRNLFKSTEMTNFSNLLSVKTEIYEKKKLFWHIMCSFILGMKNIILYTRTESKFTSLEQLPSSPSARAWGENFGSEKNELSGPLWIKIGNFWTYFLAF